MMGYLLSGRGGEGGIELSSHRVISYHIISYHIISHLIYHFQLRLNIIVDGATTVPC